MSFYNEKILPFFIDLGCSTKPMMALREQLIPKAEGVVLEIGSGSGTNFSFYDASKISLLYCLEPSVGMRNKALKNNNKLKVNMQWLDLPAEEIPLADNSVDTIVLTFTLCTIPNWQQALQGMYRVLKPEGKLLFCEHGLAPKTSTQQWQNRITPMWKKLCGGCHLNRPIDQMITSAGFTIGQMDNLFIDKAPEFVGYIYTGVALKK